MRSEQPANKEQGFKENGIDTWHGRARFVSSRQLQLGKDTIEAEKIVVATGAKPRELNVPGGHYALNSDDFLKLPELPQSLLFIGGGYIALEFAHIAARCGSRVTIMDLLPAPLPNFEPDVVQHLVNETKALGIELVMHTKVAEIKENGNRFDSVPGWYSAKHRSEKTYAYKVITDNESDHILGAHIVGPHSDETINLFALAMKTGMKARDLKTMPFIFPSSASDVPHML